MPTSLTNAKMSPELAERVHASVTGRRRLAGSRRTVAPRLVSLARFGIFATIVFIGYSLVSARRHAASETTRLRTDLQTRVHEHVAQLSANELGIVGRIEPLLVGFQGDHTEVVAPEVRGALPAMLAEPLVYVRGASQSFSSSKAIAEAAASSVKDAFVVCLLSPPAARDERSLLPRVRVAYSGSKTVEAETRNVRRLNDAVVGLPFLLPPFTQSVGGADLDELRVLKRDLDRAPIEAAKQAARARRLLVVMDEPAIGIGPTELDGERTHWVRVGLFDLTSGKVLLALRKLVDPSFISLARKSEYASGLDSCGLAVDVLAAARGAGGG